MVQLRFVAFSAILNLICYCKAIGVFFLERLLFYSSKMDQVERGAPINCTAGAVPIKNEKGKPKNANNISVAVLSHCFQAFTICYLLLR